MNGKSKNLEKIFLKFEEKDIEDVKHIGDLLVEDEEGFKELVKFHDERVELSDKHKRLLQETKFGINTDEKERVALINLLYIMRLVHGDILKLVRIIENENKILEENLAKYSL